MMLNRTRLPAFLALIVMIVLPFSPLLLGQERGDASAWTDGADDSLAYPHYGIQDLIAHKAYEIFNATYPDKAEFIRYWFLWDGADSKENSYDESHVIPVPDDNFLAWTDDGPEGDPTNYFIHNRKGWEVTDAPTWVQTLANRTIHNLTLWMKEGQPERSVYKHRASYNAGLMSKYVGDMSQYGHTDYSKWDQVAEPIYDPQDTSYQMYYEANLWTDNAMNALIDDFWNRTFEPPVIPNASRLNVATADLAKWVNGRGLPPVTMKDYDNAIITVGANYKDMLYQFMYNWDYGRTHKGVRGFNATLWNLTIQNLVAAAENLSVMYAAMYDTAWASFLSQAPDLRLVSWSSLPDPVITNDMVNIYATIGNFGPSQTNSFNLELKVGELLPKLFVTTSGAQLNAFEQKTVKFFEFRAWGEPFNITITIDNLGKVAERDEDNNVFIGGISPLPEVHGSSISLVKPMATIRRDTSKEVGVIVQNTGNRPDTFRLNATITTPGIMFSPISGPLLVPPFSSLAGSISLRTANDIQLGSAQIELRAEGANSTASLDLSLEVLERTKDPVPIIQGYSWARLEEVVTLSAESSFDPDGDSLYFLWHVPEQGNLSGAIISINYTKEGTYSIVLDVHDGNATVSLLWPLTIYPKVPSNISATAASVGVSGITVSWRPWRAGGLTAYWLEATALPGQGVLSDRGPFVSRVGPGNSSGRVGKFLPGTEVEVRLTVEAERYGNVTTDVLRARTARTDSFQDGLNLYIENSYLYLQYKPWLDPEGVREPVIEVERWYHGFRDLDTLREDIQQTKTKDTVRFTLGSNTGRYRARLTYLWVNETTAPFSLENETLKPNLPPIVNVTGAETRFELNINGTCRVWLVLGVDDPEDLMNITVFWGDMSVDHLILGVPTEEMEFISLFHNYTAIGSYLLSIKVEDWGGETSFFNKTLQVQEYKGLDTGEEGASRLVQIIIAVVMGVFLTAALIALGYVGYKFSKKETKVDFDLKDLKSDIEKEKAGTGTDFDKRRTLQIPKESIMKGPEPPKEGQTESGQELPLIKGKVTLEEE